MNGENDIFSEYLHESSLIKFLIINKKSEKILITIEKKKDI